MDEAVLPVEELNMRAPRGTRSTARVFPCDRPPLADQLGARLDFAQTCARLYQGLVPKLDAYGAFDGGPTRADIDQFREEALGHARLARRVMAALGGDPAAITRSANQQAAVTTGLCQVMRGRRTTLVEGLDAIVLAELVEREAWGQLAERVAALGDRQLEADLRAAEHTSAAHLTAARAWLAAAVLAADRSN